MRPSNSEAKRENRLVLGGLITNARMRAGRLNCARPMTHVITGELVPSHFKAHLSVLVRDSYVKEVDSCGESQFDIAFKEGSESSTEKNCPVNFGKPPSVSMPCHMHSYLDFLGIMLSIKTTTKAIGKIPITK